MKKFNIVSANLYLALSILLLTFTGCGDNKASQKQEGAEQKQTKDNVAAQQRAERWAYIAKEKQITPSESVRLLLIPDPTGVAFFDTRCLIYTNKEYRQSNMVCSNDKSVMPEASE